MVVKMWGPGNPCPSGNVKWGWAMVGSMDPTLQQSHFWAHSPGHLSPRETRKRAQGYSPKPLLAIPKGWKQARCLLTEERETAGAYANDERRAATRWDELE